MSDAVEYDPYALPNDAIQEPPVSLWAALKKIGPGIILAGSIVGSGELLLTTSLGANYGFAFLWLIIFSCIIKVFVQTELGRYAISSGKPTLGAINEEGEAVLRQLFRFAAKQLGRSSARSVVAPGPVCPTA